MPYKYTVGEGLLSIQCFSILKDSVGYSDVLLLGGALRRVSRPAIQPGITLTAVDQLPDPPSDQRDSDDAFPDTMRGGSRLVDAPIRLGHTVDILEWIKCFFSFSEAKCVTLQMQPLGDQSQWLPAS